MGIGNITADSPAAAADGQKTSAGATTDGKPVWVATEITTTGTTASAKKNLGKSAVSTGQTKITATRTKTAVGAEFSSADTTTAKTVGRATIPGPGTDTASTGETTSATGKKAIAGIGKAKTINGETQRHK